MSDIVVLDASAACNIARHTPEGLEYASVLAGASLIVTAGLYCAECANVLGRYVRLKMCSADEAKQQFRLALDLPAACIPCDSLAEQAMELSLKHGCKAYDMFYLALAKELGSALITGDKGLAHWAGIENVPCKGNRV